MTLTFPRRVMECVDICSTTDHVELYDNQVTAVVSATLKANGADLDKFVNSTSTTRRNRMLIRYHIIQGYMAAFNEDPPKYAALHWDGKMLRKIFGQRQRLWLFLSQNHLYILKASYWNYSDKQLKWDGSHRGIHKISEGIWAY